MNYSLHGKNANVCMYLSVCVLHAQHLITFSKKKKLITQSYSSILDP